MKIFKISQTENNGYDTFDSAIVAAMDEEEAKGIHPYGYDAAWGSDTWCCLSKHVDVEYIGEAKEGTRSGVLLASFNAG